VSDPEDAGTYQIENQQSVQGQVIGNNNIIYQHFGPASGSIPRVPPVRAWNVPFSHNPFFTGREEILALIRARFQTDHATALSQPQAMSGLGGIGKTQIALEYTHRYRHDYQAVLWSRADTREALISGYVAIAHLLNLPQKDEQDQGPVVQAVLRWLTAQAGWLLILDSADDLTMVREFLPTAFDGHVLLTTRAQAMGGLAYRLEVDTMDGEVGALLLLRRAGLVAHDASLETASPADVALASEITEELGGLPLAIDQAGAYVEETQCGLAWYLQLYQTRRARLLQRRGGVVPDHPELVATTWSLSFERVEQLRPAAADLLRLCAFLHFDAIPEEIITQGASHLGPRLSSVKEDPLLFDDIIAILGAYSLIRREPGSRILSIHRLVQAVLRDAMDEKLAQQWANQAVQAINQVFPDGEFATWPRCERLLPHALACVRLLEQAQIASQEAARLLNQTGTYLMQRGRYDEAEPILQLTMAMCEQVLGADHPLTACSLGNLAALYQEQGKYDQAESLGQQALAHLEQALDGNDAVPSESAFFLASSLTNLATLYEQQGKYAQAERLFVRALAIWSHTFGPVHPHIAYSQNNLGSLYEEQGRLDDAEALYQQALFVSEQALGPNHPLVATCLNNLSGLYLKYRRYTQAEPLLRRALTLCETELGPSHPLTATSLHHLAGLFFLQEAYEQAESLWRRVLLIYEHVLGLNHPRVAITLGNLASLYSAQGNYAQAEPLLKRALSILELVPGQSHPEMIALLINYADLLRAMKRDEEAKKLDLRAKQLQEDRQQVVSPQADQQQDRGFSEAVQWLHHDAFDNLDRLWNLTEEALKRRLTEQEQERVYRVKQILWALLDDMANDNLSLLEHARVGQELEGLLRQTPLIDLEERPFLNHIPGIGYVPDDFPFSSKAEMEADYFRAQFSLQGSTAYTRFLVLLRHFSYTALPAKGKAEVRKLRQAIDAWRQDWLTGPLPPVPHDGPSETAKRVAGLLEKELFRKKSREIHELPLDELYKWLHPDDAQHVATFQRAMAERFEVVKDQVIADLEKLQPPSLQQEHDLQYTLVQKRLNEFVERASEDIKEMCSLVLHEWEEVVLEESKTGEAFALYGLPPKIVYQLVPENRLHEGRNPRPWTGEGSEQVEGNLYVIDVDQNPFEVALDDDFYSAPLPLNMALRQAFDVTHQRFFTRDGDMKQPSNPECRRIYWGIVSATRALHMRREIENSSPENSIGEALLVTAI
jgi:tetratricopeptide (TPR) repeat protein